MVSDVSAVPYDGISSFPGSVPPVQSPGQRAVLVLRYYEGLDVSATAAALECSEGNVKSQTARGLAALKAAFGRQSATPGGESS